MQSIFRNICLASLLFGIAFSVLKCGPHSEQKKGNSDVAQKTYKNLDPNTKYVGMMACRQCHYDKYETFIKTGMGKSFDKATKTKSSANFGKHDVVYDKFSDLSYYPFWSGDTMKIMEFRLAPKESLNGNGKDTIHKRIETVNYIIGSGQHTNSHIMVENGYFSQMPMTFYTQKGEWDLPPGYEAGYNSRFSRKIGIECMSCHNSLPEFVEGSENKFNSVPNGISCERCHGPGEVHVKEKTAGIVVDTSQYIDYSIVNPAKLSIDLQFDVCQRCHLQGNAVLKPGKSFYDFHPGMKLSDIETIFLPKYEGAEDEFIMASHADRLKQSKCFLAPPLKGENTLRPYKNGLTCVTCHNPHVSVKATGKETFNNTCKNCHGGIVKVTCSEKREARNKVQDNCVSCHMPKSGAIDIPHVSVTDHFIRKPAKKVDVAGVKKFIGLFAVNEANPDPKIKAEAYLNQYEKFDRNPVFLDSAKKYLDTKEGYDYNLLVRYYFIKNDFINITSLTNKTMNDAWTCYRIAEAYSNTGKASEANPFYKKASELSPFNIDFLNKLGGNLFNLNKHEEAKKIYEKIISENPKFAPAYCNIGFIYFMKQDFVSAEKNYILSLALDPNYEVALMNLVQLYATQNQNEKARNILKQIIKRDPKNEKARSILKQLDSMHS